jgi:hypothetical protein
MTESPCWYLVNARVGLFQDDFAHREIGFESAALPWALAQSQAAAVL